MEKTGDPAAGVAGQPSEVESKLLRGLVDYLRQKRPELRQEWASRITEAQLLRVMRADEIFSEVTAVYDNYVNALETGSVEALRAYARDLSERIVRRASRQTRCSAPCSCCATCWHGRCSSATKATPSCSAACSMSMSRRRTGSR